MNSVSNILENEPYVFTKGIYLIVIKVQYIQIWDCMRAMLSDISKLIIFPRNIRALYK